MPSSSGQPQEIPPVVRIGAVVAAAGKSSRMEGADKTFALVQGVPLIAHTLDRLESFPPVSEIALMLAETNLEQGKTLVRQRGYGKVSQVLLGGARRQDSVRCGIESLAPCDWVIIQDGARPCLDHAMLRRGLEAAQESGAAVAGVPVKDTIKVVSSQAVVRETPPRDRLWAAQTPQIFRYSLLVDAHRRCTEPVTDDAAMLEGLGHQVKMFLGSYENLKVTTPEDLAVAEIFLRSRT